jgi:ABC-type branched-subunit amino acid transport system ATPase component
MSLLEICDVSKSFGGLKALDHVSLEVESSTIAGLIGPNGSGKTTLINVVTGQYDLDDGEVIFDGRRITGLTPHAIANRRLVRSFQVTRVFPKLTVLENMRVAPHHQKGEGLFNTFFRWKKVLDEEKALTEKATDLLAFLEIEDLKDEYAANLSGGQQKLLELGRALMSDPLMVLLDEPVAGVNPTLARKIFSKIVELKSQGVTFLVIEHNMDIVMNFCETICVMNKGQFVVGGTPREVQRNVKVIEAYLGG